MEEPAVTYVCAGFAQSANGDTVCSTWVQQLGGNLAIMPEDAATAFALGFGCIFAAWSVGYTVSVVIGMIKKL